MAYSIPTKHLSFTNIYAVTIATHADSYTLNVAAREPADAARYAMENNDNFKLARDDQAEENGVEVTVELIMKAWVSDPVQNPH